MATLQFASIQEYFYLSTRPTPFAISPTSLSRIHVLKSHRFPFPALSTGCQFHVIYSETTPPIHLIGVPDVAFAPCSRMRMSEVMASFFSSLLEQELCV
ncbi:uncharacterized protein H6S33_005236 [Morchella sextelata]|uniref:uncharacterized protein n=1 Tax=Morchella sextelata TaxID=1174677 RepID=UPI001D0474C1|nr:uncharacterized protein H6S33_005236 [Morchella sextelata]KAH0605254.1 hypothetical protein H6S33_005236 [Morchella sextelata]